MPNWNVLIESARPPAYNLPRLVEEVRQAIDAQHGAGVFIDLNEVELPDAALVFRAYLKMSGPQPPGVQTLLANVIAAHNPINLTLAQAVEARRRQSREDYRLLQNLRGVTPDQAEQWVVSNVTTLATARQVIAQMARLLVILVRAGDLED